MSDAVTRPFTLRALIHERAARRFLRPTAEGDANPFCVLALIGALPFLALFDLIAPPPEDE